jgi:hypothetical protein
MSLLATPKTRPFQYLAGALLLGLIVLRVPTLASTLALNLAHRDLLYWSPLLPYEEGKCLLERVIDLGERAGPRWLEYGHDQRARERLAQMESESWYGRSQRWVAFETGRRLEAQGDAEAAIMAYQEAADQTELRAPSFYAIYRLTRTSDSRVAEGYLHRLTALVPAVQVHRTGNDQYQLLGLDLDEWSIAWDGAHIPMTLYWQTSTSVDTPRQWNVGGWQYIQVRDRLYQIGVVSNLLPNGGFEQDLSTMAALPMGYHNTRDFRLRQTGEITDFLRQYHNLLQNWRNGYPNHVAAMTAPSEKINGFSTSRVPIDDDALYLFSGWMRTTGESEGYLGGVWERDKTEIIYWKIAKWSSQTTWRRYASVANVPDEATEFKFMALRRGIGTVLFDDVLFCEIPLPDLRADRGLN